MPTKNKVTRTTPAAKNSCRQYRQVLDTAMFPVVVTNLESQRVLYFNNAAAAFFQLSLEEAIGTYISDYWVTPGHRKNFIEQITSLGKVNDFEAHLRTSTGQDRYVVIAATEMVFEDQPAISSVFKDITRQREADEARRRSEKKYLELYNLMRLMADTVPDMIWAKDIEDNYLFANKAICRDLLKCELDEPIGRNDLFFARRECERGQQHTFGRICIDSDKMVRTSGKAGRFLEDGLVRGRYMMLDVHKAPMLDVSGNIVGTVGSGRDVTQDMKNLSEKRASEERYRLLAENVRDVIWTMNEELKFTFFSPSIEEMLGYTPEESLTTPVAQYFTETSMPFFKKFREHYAKVARQKLPTKELQFWEFELRHRNGSLVWVETITSAMRDKSGDFRGVVGVSRDVTSRVETQKELEKAKEQALAASRAKSEFLANMSHEIRTPMNGILGMLQLLQVTELDSQQEGYVETAIQSGRSLLRLITDILDFSKIEAGKIDLTATQFNLVTFLQNVIYTFANLIDGKQIDLRLRVSREVPQYISADNSRLQQILYNLLGNSVKFTSQGRIHLHVNAESTAEGQVRLKFLLEDTGIGIPDHMRHQLFEPFVQADGSFQRKYRGTGLGLSIVRQLITLMGGTIDLHSREGCGTVAEFSILAHPVVSGKSPEPTTPDNRQECCGPVEPADILVVEDEQINAMVIAAMLRNLGHTVTLATNGREAIELLKSTRFDCILMDIQMPELDGIETARIIRASTTPGNSRLPIIAVTAHAMKGDRENFLAAGMDDYLTKPVDAAVLAQTLQRVLASQTAATYKD